MRFDDLQKYPTLFNKSEDWDGYEEWEVIPNPNQVIIMQTRRGKHVVTAITREDGLVTIWADDDDEVTKRRSREAFFIEIHQLKMVL